MSPFLMPQLNFMLRSCLHQKLTQHHCRWSLRMPHGFSLCSRFFIYSAATRRKSSPPCSINQSSTSLRLFFFISSDLSASTIKLNCSSDFSKPGCVLTLTSLNVVGPPCMNAHTSYVTTCNFPHDRQHTAVLALPVAKGDLHPGKRKKLPLKIR